MSQFTVDALLNLHETHSPSFLATMNNRPNVTNLPGELQDHTISLLTPLTALALSRTNKYFRRIVPLASFNGHVNPFAFKGNVGQR